MKSKQKLSTQEGFTLIELLVVMAIIGVLASLIFLNVESSLGKARDAQRKNDLRTIQTALELYHSDNGEYPTTEWVNSKNGGEWISGLTASYIKIMPADPKNSGCISNITNPRDDSGSPNCFTYAYYSGGWNNFNSNDNYILTTRLEQYPGTDLSQKSYYFTNGAPCCSWVEDITVPAAKGMYTVSNP